MLWVVMVGSGIALALLWVFFDQRRKSRRDRA